MRAIPRSLAVLALAVALAPAVQADGHAATPGGAIQADCATVGLVSTTEGEARADVYVMKGATNSTLPADDGTQALMSHARAAIEAALDFAAGGPEAAGNAADVRVHVVIPASGTHEGYHIAFSIDVQACLGA